MSSSGNNSSSSGVGFFGVLTIVFVVLKLVGVINWSWILVLSPLWGSVLVSLIVAIVVAIRLKK